jgi:hypothetical protein
MTSNNAVETTSPAASHPSVRLTKAERRRMTVDVYDADYTAVFLGVPRDRVAHLPQREKADRGKPLLQCGVYEAIKSCPQADLCPCVHADLSGLQPQHIHVNYAWKSVEQIPYDCMPVCGEDQDSAFEVFAPNNRPPMKLVDRQAILATRGSLAAVAGQELSQCAHFYFNRMCNRGKNCLYIHVAHIDPAAADRQLAPTPDAIGPTNDEPCSQTGAEDESASPCTPALSRVQSSRASPCCRHQNPAGFAPSSAAPLSPALSSSLKSRASPDDFRPASVLSLPLSSAAPSAPTSGQYSDADISAILAQYPCDLDTVAASCAHSAATTPKTGPKCLERLDLVRGRVVYYERDTMTPSQFRHNPYSQW